MGIGASNEPRGREVFTDSSRRKQARVSVVVRIKQNIGRREKASGGGIRDDVTGSTDPKDNGSPDHIRI
jgi:hypothetical protein